MKICPFYFKGSNIFITYFNACRIKAIIQFGKYF